jgi:hydrogenase maturation factor HypF (carbamoyltransferase family)
MSSTAISQLYIRSILQLVRFSHNALADSSATCCAALARRHSLDTIVRSGGVSYGQAAVAAARLARDGVEADAV